MSNNNGNSPASDPRLTVLTATDKYYFVAVEYLEVREMGSSIITSSNAKSPHIVAERKVANHVLNIHPITFALQNQGKYPYFAVIYDRMITKKEYEAAMLLINTAKEMSEKETNSDKILDNNLIDASDKFTREN